MRLSEHPPIHLMYCLNVHSGESWQEVFAGIRVKALAVRERVAFGKPFALGLRLGAAAAQELARPEPLAEFKNFLQEHDLYVTAINGFPYGRFHGVGVKEQVYRPDWTTDERLEYTLLLARLLAELLPSGAAGSISTVPVSFRTWVQDDSARQAVRSRLLALGRELGRLYDSTGRRIHVGLEPEPACCLETTEETVAFFNELFRAAPALGFDENVLRRHLGVCLDTCHLAVGFEDPAAALDRFKAEGLRISRIQLSAAPKVQGWEQAEEALSKFDEPTYLHQVTARFPDGTLKKWTDLPEARR